MAIFAVAAAVAQGRNIEHRLVVDIPFCLAGESSDELRSEQDSILVAHALRELELISRDTNAIIKSVLFYGSVSPEGPVQLNKRLSKARIITAEKIVRERINIPKSIPVSYDNQYIPWHQQLLPAIKADSTVPYRNELLSIVYRPEGSKEADNRLNTLKNAQEGKLWEITSERYFADLRKGGAIIIVERTILEDLLQVRDIFGGVKMVMKKDLSFPMPVAEPAPAPEPEEPKKMNAVSIKTNGAAVAALITNIGFEVKLADRWSLDVMGAYSPYNMIVKDRKLRVFGTRPEVRYWWGEPLKRGHFLGLHGFTSAFNVQIGDKARYQDPNHALWGVGVAYGYAMPLGKKEKWGVEFTLGLGYARVKYDKYDGAINGPFIERKTINYFGPTRLGINFSYRFDVEKNKSKKQK